MAGIKARGLILLMPPGQVARYQFETVAAGAGRCDPRRSPPLGLDCRLGQVGNSLLVIHMDQTRAATELSIVGRMDLQVELPSVSVVHVNASIGVVPNGSFAWSDTLGTLSAAMASRHVDRLVLLPQTTASLRAGHVRQIGATSK